MSLITRILREPLLHFFAIGALLFVAYEAMNDTAEPTPDLIVITPERAESLASNFEAVWRRQPNERELQALVDEDVREEILYREALKLGLDSGDTIIRRRLRQKMEFLTDAGADLLEPEDGDLEAYLETNAETYRQQPRLAFEQIYLGEAPTTGSAEDLLAELRADPDADTARLGVRTLLPADVPLSYPRSVDGAFGEGFFQALAELPEGDWAGPVASSYGVHLVRVTAREDGRMPTLEEVREFVLRDWRKTRADELADAYYQRLKDAYTIVVETAGADGEATQ